MTAAIAEGPDAAPEREVTFLHTADWQLGMTRHFLAGEAQHTYDAARLDAVAEIGRLARAQKAEFVVVCGDVFDDPKVSSRVVRRALAALADFDCPVYLLPGNHDPADASSIYRSSTFLTACPANVHVLCQAGPLTVREGITLIAAPWQSKKPTADLIAAQLAQLEPGDDIRIVVDHGGLDLYSPAADPAIVDTATLEQAVASTLVDYIALGDRHSLTAVGDSQRIWYSGAPEVTDFNHVEVDSGHVLAVRLRRGHMTQVDVTPHRVGRWAFHTLLDDINDATDVGRLAQQLAELPDKMRTVVQLGLVGTLGLAEKSALDEILEEYADHFAALQIWDRKHDLNVMADPTAVADLPLSGYAAEAAAELAQRAAGSDPEDAAAAASALGLLFRLAGGAA